MLRSKLGLQKSKFPSKRWSQITLADFVKPVVDYREENFLQTHLSNGRKFFFESGHLPQLGDDVKELVISEADEILKNRFRYFFYENYDLGKGPDWFLSPKTGKRAKSDRHWCDVEVFDPEVGDIKFIWEPSRFAWVYTLVRAFAATGKNEYAEKFWFLFESWLEANQPNMGPNYACGQECAIRLMAMCFALYSFASAPATSRERQVKLVKAIAVHAERIEKNIDLAISTKTNHSLTEAAGLYTTGILFPEFKHSDRWQKLGKEILTNEGLKQIYRDGCYIQHSMNYHRLMLQDFLWVLRLAELNDDSFCDKLVSRVTKATDFLYQMQDEESGRLPNYGANDGALILPLNSCGYLDYRPVLQAMNYLFRRTRLYENGPWDEDLLWFFGQEALTARLEPARRTSKAYQSGGYYTIRGKDSWAMMRCHSFKNRPGHADSLHLDLWWKGRNILRDSGTYMYNCSEPWQSFFGSTAAHNTIVVDHADQMQRVSRFMWFHWTKAKFLGYKSIEGGVEIMQGEHYGYCRGKERIVHRRSVLLLPQDYWVVVDDVLGTGSHEVGLCWQLCDGAFELKDNSLTMDMNNAIACVVILGPTGDTKYERFKGDDAPLGWRSLYYGSREPSPTLICSDQVALPTRFVTLVGLGDIAKNTVLKEPDSLSWVSGTSGQEFAVGLNLVDS